jgi:hypothetical protein
MFLSILAGSYLRKSSVQFLEPSCCIRIPAPSAKKTDKIVRSAEYVIHLSAFQTPRRFLCQVATPVGFEPTRGDPIGLAGRRLSRSAKVSLRSRAMSGDAQRQFGRVGKSAGLEPQLSRAGARTPQVPFTFVFLLLSLGVAPGQARRASEQECAVTPATSSGAPSSAAEGLPARARGDAKCRNSAQCIRSTSGLVAEYIVAIDVTRARFLPDAGTYVRWRGCKVSSVHAG